MFDIEAYTSWNNAFFKYFIESHELGTEVFLYVNRKTIDHIGEINNLGSTDDFVKAVLIDSCERGSFFYQLYKLYVGINPSDKVRHYARSKSLFEFAVAFTDTHLRRSHLKFPYLNYAILAIYIASEAQSNDDRAIGKKIKDFLKEKGDNGQYDSLEQIFTTLHNDCPSFKNLKLTNYRYIGLLKYQLVLSDKQIDKLCKSLYDNGFDFDESISYEEKVYRIIDYVEPDIKQLLKTSLYSEPHKIRISDIIDNFDADEYKASHPEGCIRKYIGTFVHSIYLGDETPRLVLLSDIRTIHYVSDKYTIFPEENETMLGLNPNHILVNGTDKVFIEDRSVKTENLNVRSLKNEGIVFFKKYNENYYIESRNLSKTETFVAVRSENKILTKWKSFVEKSAQNCEEITTNIDSDLLGGGWKLFVVEGFTNQYYKDVIDVDGKKMQVNKMRIEQKGGIKPKEMKNVYLSNALPYFEFPTEIVEDRVKFFMYIDNTLSKNNEDYKLYFIGEKLIVNIKNHKYFKEHSCDISITIEYNDELLFKTKEEFSFSACLQNVTYDIDNLYKYNKWGEIETKANQIPYIIGNKVVGGSEFDVSGVSDKIGKKYLLGEDLSRFYFHNLLSACCYMSDSKSITSKYLDKCIRYSATRKNIEPQYKEVKQQLVNAGYLCPQYDGMTKYQANPPSFVRIPKFTLDTIPGTYYYMLVGCYTHKFLSGLLNYCNDNCVSVYIYDSSSKESLLPPTIILTNPFNPNDFANQTDNLCEIFEHDLSMSILNMLPSTSEYENTLSDIPDDTMNIKLLPYANNNGSYPRVRTSVSEGYNRTKWIEYKNNKFYKSTVAEFEWMYLWCKSKQDRPLLLHSGTGEICFPASLNLPYMYQRVLFLMNLGQPIEEKAFICNNTLTKDPLYTKLKVYKIGTDENRLKKFVRLLTNNGIDPTNNKIKAITTKMLFSVSLWKLKQKMANKPQLLCLKCYDEIIAVAEYEIKYIKVDDGFREQRNEKVFVKKDKYYFRVINSSCNEVFSNIINKTNRYFNWEQYSFNFSEETYYLPDEKDYNVEKITIK